MEIRPIRTQTDYQDALREVELLFNAPANTPDSDRLDVLSTLVEAYEKAHFPIAIPDPIAAIQYYMDACGWSDSDLEQCIGSRVKVSEILSRKHSLTLEMIRKLNQELGIPAEILIQPYESLQTSA
ncbi:MULTISPECIES: transcriptional regulator [unclassified Microcoleus]|uniref:transcriptional regulator n=1 Tax=unclassified Microcoleus TaxID=2642155 RepID=UPI002FD0B249